MKRLQSILCTTLLTLSLSSAAFAGQISGAPGQIDGAPGQISGLTDEAYRALLGLLSAILG
ncbi:MAG: hypothetical protein ACREA9_09885 [Pyrinomonadaceae bacterium]